MLLEDCAALAWLPWQPLCCDHVGIRAFTMNKEVTEKADLEVEEVTYLSRCDGRAINMDYPDLEDEEITEEADYPALEDEEITEEADYPGLEDEEVTEEADYHDLEDEEVTEEADYPDLEDEEITFLCRCDGRSFTMYEVVTEEADFSDLEDED